ncbi:MAG: dTDP-4-dehydrorhamnose 3,5-epimerase [Lachnospiraceae bacterium]|nr:dTDP-4-dehydrorhamnose 3,5-epimerase [Lachnospiraceae bacterium]
MDVKAINTQIPGVVIIEPTCYGDSRGWFIETYNKQKLAALGIGTDFVQDNSSFSANKGTIRGLHFQSRPYTQTKLVRCVRGAVLDVAVDIRKGSPTYLKWVSVELSAENRRQLFIPKGFAHGFITLTDDVEFAYKVDAHYAPDHDMGIRFDDPDIGVDWGIDITKEAPILSAADKARPYLKDIDTGFIYGEI